MNSTPDDIEVHAACNMEAVTGLLSSSIGPLSTDCASDQDPKIYAFESTTVVLGASEDGFLSIWIRGASKWPTSQAFGRYLAAALDCIVRCDPGDEFSELSPYSNVFLQIERGTESMVAWG